MFDPFVMSIRYCGEMFPMNYIKKYYGLVHRAGSHTPGIQDFHHVSDLVGVNRYGLQELSLFDAKRYVPMPQLVVLSSS